jgi:hypothetical protein
VVGVIMLLLHPGAQKSAEGAGAKKEAGAA